MHLASPTSQESWLRLEKRWERPLGGDAARSTDVPAGAEHRAGIIPTPRAAGAATRPDGATMRQIWLLQICERTGK